MKVLLIIAGYHFGKEHINNIQILDTYMKQSGANIEYCGISSHDDFYIFEDTIQFKYKIINNKLQLSKICDFITEYKEQLDYNWYIKIRPDIKLLDHIPYDKLSEDAINGRARVYQGLKQIKYGNSVYGKGRYKHVNHSHYVNCEEHIILDDMIYIFHKNIIQNGAFEKIPPTPPNTIENEWFHSNIFTERNIKMNVIGINMYNTKLDVYSGDINIM